MEYILNKKKPFFKFVIPILGWILFLLPIYSIVNIPVYSAETLTLEKAVEWVQTNNTDLKILNEQISYKVWQKAEVTRISNKLRSEFSYATYDNELAMARQIYFDPLKAGYELNDLQRQKERLIKSLKNETESAYLELTEAKTDLLQARYVVTVAQKEELAKKLMFELGRVARIDFDRAVVNRIDAESVVTSLNRSIELSYFKLNALMGRPSTDRYDVIKPALELNLPLLLDVPKAVEQYKLNSDQLLKQEEAQKLAAKDLELVREYGKYTNIAGDRVIETLAEKERNAAIEQFRLDIALRNADYDFRIAWNNLQNVYESYVSEHGRYILSVKEIEIERIKYERGLISAVQYLQAASKHEVARLARQKAIKAFHLNKGTFMINYTVPNSTELKGLQ